MEENMMEMNRKDINNIKGMNQGRLTRMSLMNLNLSISYFNIDIHIKKDEEQRSEKMRKIIDHEKRVRNILEERNHLNNQFLMYRQ